MIEALKIISNQYAIIPSLIFYAGFLIAILLFTPVSKILSLLVPVIGFFYIYTVKSNIHDVSITLMDYQLKPFYFHFETKVVAFLICAIAFFANLIAINDSSKKQLAISNLISGSAIGILFCQDFVSVYFYMQILSFTTIVGLFANNQRKITTICIILCFSNLLFMIGIFSYIPINISSTIEAFDPNITILFFDYFIDRYTLSVWFMLLSMLVLFAAPPFSALLLDSTKKASNALFFTIGTINQIIAIFILSLLFKGFDILIYIGIAILGYAGIFALIENDIRKISAYYCLKLSSILLICVGLGYQIPMDILSSIFLGVFASILMFFTISQSIIKITGCQEISKIGGLINYNKIFILLALLSLLSLVAFPFSILYYVYNTMVHFITEEFKYLQLVIISSQILSILIIVRLLYFAFFNKKNYVINEKLTFNYYATLSILIIISFSQFLIELINKITNLELVILSHKYYNFQSIFFAIKIIIFTSFAFYILKRLIKPKTCDVVINFDALYILPIKIISFSFIKIYQLVKKLKNPKKIFEGI